MTASGPTARISVRVTPGARSDEIAGWQGDSAAGSGQAVLRVRVRAAPERGKANEAVCRLVARALGLPPTSVTLSRGAASRGKLLRIDGLSDDEVRRRLGASMI